MSALRMPSKVRSLRHKLAASAAIQCLGPGLLFLLPFAIVSTQGVAAQGSYATQKALFDLVVVTGIFGFPQSVMVLRGRERTDPARLYWLAALYGAALWPVLAAALWLAHPTPPLRTTDVVLLAFGAAAVIVRDIWRGLVIGRNDGVGFALYTIVPAVSIALVVVFAVSAGVPIQSAMPWLFGAAGAVALATSVLLYREPLIGRFWRDVPYRPLLTRGHDAFAQAVLVAAQTYLLYAWLGTLGDTGHAAGLFSLGLLLYQGAALPWQMTSPVVMQRWLGKGAYEAWRGEFRLLVGFGRWLVLAVLASVGLMAAATAADQVDSEAASMFAWIALSLIPMHVARLCAIASMTLAQLRGNAWAAAARAVATLAAFALLSQVVPLLAVAAAAAWCIGECVGAAVGVAWCVRVCGLPWVDFLPGSSARSAVVAPPVA